MPTISTPRPSMFGNMLWNTIGSVFYQGCLWLLTVLVVRLSDSYLNSGMLAFAMSIGNIYTALSTYMIRTYQVADIEQRYSTSNYVAARAITICGAYLLCGVYAMIASPSFETFLVVVAFLLFKADESFVNVLYGRDQVSERLDWVGLSQIIRGVAVVGIFSIIVVRAGLAAALVGIFIGCALVTVFFDFPHTRRLGDSLAPKISIQKLTSLLRTCFPSMLGSVVGGLVVTSARQYFGIVYGEEALGIYASVATPCVIIQVLAQNLYAPLLLPIARCRSQGDRTGVKRRTATLIGLVLLVALTLSIMLSIGARPLLVTFYGPSISPYTDLLPPALFVMTGIALAAVISDLLILSNKMHLSLFINSIAFIIDALLIAPCTAMWFMNGINIALAAAYTIACAIGLFLVGHSICDVSPQSPRK